MGFLLTMQEIQHISIKKLQSTCADLNLAQQIDGTDLNFVSAGSVSLLTSYLLSLEMFSIQLDKTLSNQSCWTCSEREVGPCGLQRPLSNVNCSDSAISAVLQHITTYTATKPTASKESGL